jgi:hypothetical protein
MGPLLAVLGAVVGGVVLLVVDGLFAGPGTWSSVSFIADWLHLPDTDGLGMEGAATCVHVQRPLQAQTPKRSDGLETTRPPLDPCNSDPAPSSEP